MFPIDNTLAQLSRQNIADDELLVDEYKSSSKVNIDTSSMQIAKKMEIRRGKVNFGSTDHHHENCILTGKSCKDRIKRNSSIHEDNEMHIGSIINSKNEIVLKLSNKSKIRNCDINMKNIAFQHEIGIGNGNMVEGVNSLVTQSSPALVEIDIRKEKIPFIIPKTSSKSQIDDQTGMNDIHSEYHRKLYEIFPKSRQRELVQNFIRHKITEDLLRKSNEDDLAEYLGSFCDLGPASACAAAVIIKEHFK